MVARRRSIVAPQRPSAAHVASAKAVEVKKGSILTQEVAAKAPQSWIPTGLGKVEANPTGFLLTNNYKDIEAINVYITRTRAKTSEANNLQIAWLLWYTNLNWWSKSFNKDIYNTARDKRRAFNEANGTPEDPNGMTMEQMFPDGDPLVTAWEKTVKYTKVVAVAASAGVLGVGAFYLNKLRK